MTATEFRDKLIATIESYGFAVERGHGFNTILFGGHGTLGTLRFKLSKNGRIKYTLNINNKIECKELTGESEKLAYHFQNKILINNKNLFAITIKRDKNNQYIYDFLSGNGLMLIPRDLFDGFLAFAICCAIESYTILNSELFYTSEKARKQMDAMFNLNLRSFERWKNPGKDVLN